MNSTIRALIFDYGGTLDSNGQHWASVIQQAYKDADVLLEADVYKQAYIYAERKMATDPLILPDYDFKQTLETKILAQFDFLEEAGEILDRDKIVAISQNAYEVARYHIQVSKELLDDIYGLLPMVVVSNFYGNLRTVLKDFGVSGYFDQVIESAVVGVRKPNPAIFQLGIDALELAAGKCLVVGDSYRKDIVPAKECGCKTLWLKGKVWGDEKELTDESAADFIVSDFTGLKSVVNEMVSK